MIVRETTQDDQNSVLELMAYLQPEDPVLSGKLSGDVYTRILESNSFTITVAQISDVIVDSCYINIIPNLTRAAASYAVIENVVTHPGYRRQGVGKALVSHALDMAKANGCYKVMLLTGGDLSDSCHSFN